MVRFINRFTGNEMWVAEDRVEYYKAAGHKPAVIDPKPIKPVTASRKTTNKKSTKK